MQEVDSIVDFMQEVIYIVDFMQEVDTLLLISCRRWN
jgi:hypothetical protein